MNTLNGSNWSNENLKIDLCCVIIFCEKGFKSSTKFTMQLVSICTTMYIHNASVVNYSPGFIERKKNLHNKKEIKI